MRKEHERQSSTLSTWQCGPRRSKRCGQEPAAEWLRPRHGRRRTVPLTRDWALFSLNQPSLPAEGAIRGWQSPACCGARSWLAWWAQTGAARRASLARRRSSGCGLAFPARATRRRRLCRLARSCCAAVSASQFPERSASESDPTRRLRGGRGAPARRWQGGVGDSGASLEALRGTAARWDPARALLCWQPMSEKCELAWPRLDVVEPASQTQQRRVPDSHADKLELEKK